MRASGVAMEILWLGEPACHDRAAVGGKAANLSRLAAAYRVPPGFCLTATASERWGAALVADTPGAVPGALCEQVAAAYRRLADACGVAEPPVAVRSSAIDEDTAAASFAGQHATWLNVVGPAAVAEAVVRCWASARSAGALAYRRGRGLTTEGIRLAVLVQHLVAADLAAVVFSADPVTGDREQVVINASWGLGESVVGGTVTPDTYRVRKADLAIAARQVAEKRRMTVLVPGGTREVAVPRLLRAHPALSDEQVVELARLGRSLEAAMGGPVDLECAYAGGRLYVLQCRPITALGVDAAPGGHAP